MKTSKVTGISLAEFGTGILAGLVAEGVSTISVRGLDAGLVKAAEKLEALGHKLNFYMILDSLHGDSPVAREAIGGAVSRGLGFFDADHSLHLNIHKNDVDLYFENLPLSEKDWRVAAVTVLSEASRMQHA